MFDSPIIKMLLTAIVALFILHLGLVLFNRYGGGAREGYLDNTQLILTDKQKISLLLLDIATKEDEKFMVDIQPIMLALMLNPLEPLVESLYNTMRTNQTIIKVLKNGTTKTENPGVEFSVEFDDFFNSLMEIFINSGKIQAKPEERALVEKLDTAYNSWKTKKFPTQANKTISGSSTPATDKDKVALQKLLEQVAGSEPLPEKKGSPTKSGSEAPATASASLDNLDRPSASVVETASGSTAVRNTSPGLAQGQDYNKGLQQQLVFPSAPRCQPTPSQCHDSEPIMDDGRPFNPNEYIRKDSIPCWNCNLM